MRGKQARQVAVEIKARRSEHGSSVVRTGLAQGSREERSAHHPVSYEEVSSHLGIQGKNAL